MKNYSSYKNTGVDWLEFIPSHWSLRKMKYTFDEKSDKGYASLPLLSATQNHGVIKKSEYENRTVEATKSLETLKLVEVGDFVISLRSFQGGIEYSYERGIISPAYTILRPTHILASYFKYLGKSPAFIQLLKSMVTGIREGQNIDYSKLRENLLPIPPKKEQEFIASYLDAATAKIDEAIAQQQRMIDLLNERKQIIVNELVTKGLNNQVEFKDSGFNWIGIIPSHWEVKKLKYYINPSREKSNANLPYIGLENIESHTGKFISTDSVYDISQALLCKKGDVIFGKLRPYLAKAFLADSDYCCSSEFVVMRDAPNPEFLLFVLLSGYFVDKVDASTYGAKMPRADIDYILNLPIAVPPIKEQIEIVAKVKMQFDVIDRMIAPKQKLLDLLQERKQIIINDVVTGKVRVV